MALKTVHIPLDAGLSRLLRASVAGQPHYMASMIVAGMANACFPGHEHASLSGVTHRTGAGAGTVQLENSMMPVIADHLSALLGHAREAADPAADVLAGVLAREFGRAEPAPPRAPGAPS